MNRSQCNLATLAMAAFLGLCSTTVAAPATKDHPNIVLILSDDVGIGDVHCTGGPYKTPNLDKLAAGGTKFTHCYSTPLCGPSRCELLTGRYPFRTGFNSNQSRDAVDPSNEVMFSTVMKKAGYATASVGKWSQVGLDPGLWGFEEYLVFAGSGRYWRKQTKTYRANGKEMELAEGEYMPDLMHKFATDFIDKHKNDKFLLYYTMSHMHGPIVPTSETNNEKASPEELYVENIEYMDKLVGKLMDELDKRKLREKTVFVFTGDNGTARFGQGLSTVDGKTISGMKGTMLEGGSRVPLLVSWPGTTPAGKTNQDLIDFSDFFPTLAELGGGDLPKGVKIDGQSFAKQIRGEKGKPREWVYVELNGQSYVRDAKYKLRANGELLDLSEAPFKEVPIARDTADAAAKAARERLQSVLDDHQAAPPNKNTPPKQKQRAQRRRAARAAA